MLEGRGRFARYLDRRASSFRNSRGRPDGPSIPAPPSAAKSQRNKILKDTLLLNVASIVSQVTSVAQSFLIMRFLAPGALGIWLGFGIALGYTAYIHLGLDYGLGLRLPFYRGQGDAEKEGKCEDSVFFAWTSFALVFAVGMTIYALGQRRTNPMLGWGLLVVALMAPLDQQSGFLGRWQNAALADFRLPSYIAVARSIATALLLVPLAHFFGAMGLMLGSLGISIAVWLTWWSQTKFRFRRRVSSRAVLEMLEVGFPVLVISLAATLIQTVDRLIIASRLGAANLGYYGATSLGGGLLLAVLSQSGSAMGPHIPEELGRSQGATSVLERFLVKPTLINSFLAAAGIMVLMFVTPVFIRLVLPRYVLGIPAVYGFLPGFFFLVLVQSSQNILANVLIARSPRRILAFVGFQGIALLVEVGCAFLFIARGLGIAGVAVASTLSYAVYGISILSATTWAVVPDPERRLPFLLKVAVPFVYCGVATCIAMWVASQLAEGPVAQSAIGLALSLVSLVPLTLWLEARIGVLPEIRAILDGVRTRLFGVKTAKNVD